MDKHKQQMTYDLSEAPSEVRALVAALSEGKEIVFLSEGRPAAKLVAAAPVEADKPVHNDNGEREETWHPSDFDRPLPKNLTEALLERFNCYPLAAAEQD